MRRFVFVAGEVARSRYAWRIFVGRFGSVFPGGASSVTARKQPDEVIGWRERERERGDLAGRAAAGDRKEPLSAHHLSGRSGLAQQFTANHGMVTSGGWRESAEREQGVSRARGPRRAQDKRSKQAGR